MDMDEGARTALLKLGRDAAEDIAGKDAVEDIAVVPGADYEYRPIYRFSFLLDQSRIVQRIGLVRLRLTQRLHDELIAMGDEHYPRIEILDRADWSKRAVA